MKKVLIVDDDEGVTFTFKITMDALQANYDILTASDGVKCMKALQQGITPDIILLDIMMPNMDGIETIKQIKTNDEWKDIPIIFLTARMDLVNHENIPYKVEGYIEKPFEAEYLKEKIDGILTNGNNQ